MKNGMDLSRIRTKQKKVGDIEATLHLLFSKYDDANSMCQLVICIIESVLICFFYVCSQS